MAAWVSGSSATVGTVRWNTEEAPDWARLVTRAARREPWPRRERRLLVPAQLHTWLELVRAAD